MALKISIVTVCFNMVSFIEQTIKSVLSQGYSNLEYIIIDGGSTDGTQEIIEKYEDKLAYYVSEADDGMYDALSKGFSHATGDVLAWLNADDIYFNHTFRVVNDIFENNSDIAWIGGKYCFLSENGEKTKAFPKCSGRSREDISNGWCRYGLLGYLQQESMFWRKELYERCGGIDISYRYAGDFELWTRFAGLSSLARVDVPLAAFRMRSASLSRNGAMEYRDEILKSFDANHPLKTPFLWSLLGKNKIANQLLRMLRYRKITYFYYSGNDGVLKRKERLMNASNHNLASLLFKYPDHTCRLKSKR